MSASHTYRQQHTTSRQTHGLAMVDLVITVLVMGITAAVAAPRFTTALNSHQLEAAARRMAAVMNCASCQARATSQAITLTFDTGADSIVVTGMDDPNHPGQPWTIQLSAVAEGVDLTTADFDGNPVVTFGVDGRPDAPGSLTLDVTGMQKMVAINTSTGKATLP